MSLFRDRSDAGMQLAKALSKYAGAPDTIVIGLPRGGLEVARVIAEHLRLPLDLIAVRKIGAPDEAELAIGAVDEFGNALWNEQLIRQHRISENYLKSHALSESREAQRRTKLYRADLPPLILENKRALLVDDGIATGFTMMAAIHSIKKRRAKEIIVAVPVGAHDSVAALSKLADHVICLHEPHYFGAVGNFYDEFSQLTDDDVRRIMHLSEQGRIP